MVPYINLVRNFLLAPKLGPTSSASPGTFNLSLHKYTKSSLPTIYAPLLAIPAPKFLINEPTHISAPTSVGSLILKIQSNNYLS